MRSRGRNARRTPPPHSRWPWWLAVLVVLSACATPALTASPPGADVPRITTFAIEPGRVESSCPITFRINFEDAGADVTRAVMRWRARTGYQRYHDRTEVIPIAPSELAGRTAGHTAVVIVPPHAGSWLYRVQLEDAQVARPTWRRPAWTSLSDRSGGAHAAMVQDPMRKAVTRNPGGER